MQFSGASLSIDELCDELVIYPECLEIVKDVLKQKSRSVFVSNDVLTKMLSYVSLSDIFNVIQVCKTWYACMQRPEFWTRHVRKRVEEKLIRKNMFTRNEISFIVETFHPFLWKHASMEQRFRWIFCRRKDKFSLSITKDDFISLYISPVGIGFDNGFKFVPEHEFGQVYLDMVSESKYVQSPHTKEWLDHGKCYQRKCESPKNTWLRSGDYDLVYENGLLKECYGYCILSNGFIYEGNCDLYRSRPHGKGKWTFPDGTTLTGDDVAYDGLPHGKGQDDELEWFAGHRVDTKKRKME